MAASSVQSFLLSIVVSAIATCAGSVALETRIGATAVPEVGTKNVTAHFCPHPCTIGNETLCYPPPCPFPGCVDPAKHKPTDCCAFCPNGPNCSGPDRTIIPFQHWKIVHGKNCTCEDPAGSATCV